MAGLFDLNVWEDGDEPDNTPNADDLNLEWRDSFKFLMGLTRPIIHLISTSGTAITTTEVLVPFTVEALKRGNILHSNVTNNTQVTIPITGQYQGYMWGGFDTFSTVATRAWVRLKINGNTTVVANQKPELLAGWNVHSTITLDANANDIITMSMQTSTGTAVMGTSLTRAPRLVLWYVGDYS